MQRWKALNNAIANGAYFSDEHADRIIKFAENYITPQFIKGKFQLLEWQKDWLRNLYGWRDKDGNKLFKRALLHVAKKAGKTLLCSIICLFELYYSESPSPLVVSASTSRENATQVFKELAHSVRNNKKLDDLSRIVASQKRLFYDKANAEYRALAADAGTCEGLNVSMCLVDEMHAFGTRGEKMYQALEYSTIARKDATLVVISTAGSDLNSLYFQSVYMKAKKVLSGEDADEHFFPTVYEIPEGYDLEQAESWKLANPSLGTSFSEDSFRADLQAAKSDTPSWLSFQRYRLNTWISGSDEIFIDPINWDGLKKNVSEEQLRECPCFIGVDLSQTCEPTSISAVWILPNKHYHCQSWCFVAEEGVRKREKASLPRYQCYIAHGYMTMTQGDMIDAAKVKQAILDLTKRYRVQSVVFDAYSAFLMANDIGQEGIPVFRCPTSFRYMNTPLKEFSLAVGEGRVSHDGNSWLRFCMANVRTETNTYGETRPHKERRKDHDDGAIAVFLAFQQVLAQNAGQAEPRKSVYDDRGIDFF